MIPAKFLLKKCIPIVLCFLAFSESYAQLASPGAIYAATSDGKIYELNEDFSQKRLVVETGIEIVSMAISSEGQVFAVDGYKLYTLNFQTGSAEDVAPMPDIAGDLDYMGEIAIDRNDEIYVIKSSANNCSAAYYVYHFNADTKAFAKKWVHSYSCPDGSAFNSLAFDPYTNQPYGLLKGSGTVFGFEINDSESEDLVNSEKEVVGSTFGNEFDQLFFKQNGSLLLIGSTTIGLHNRFNGQITTYSDSLDLNYTSISSIFPAAESLSDLVVIEEELDFGQVIIGKDAVLSVTMGNMSNQDLTITLTTGEIVGANLSIPESVRIPAGESVSVNAVITPMEAGGIDGYFTIAMLENETGARQVNFFAEGFELHTVNENTLYGLMPHWNAGTADLLSIDIEEGTYERFSTLSRQLNAVAINSNGEMFGASGKSLYMVDPISGKMQLIRQLGFDITSMAFNWDHHLIVTNVSAYSYYSSNLGIYDVDATGGSPKNVFGTGVEYNAPGSIAISPKGEFVTINSSAHLGITDTLANIISSIELDTYYVKDIFFDSEGTLFGLFDTTVGKFQLRKINMATGETKPQALEFDNMVWLVRNAAFSPVNGARDIAGNDIRTFPNPFGTDLTVSFNLNTPQPVKLQIFDLGGRRVFSTEYDFTSTGMQRMQWNGRDAAGSEVLEGYYLLQLQVGNEPPIIKRIIYSH